MKEHLKAFLAYLRGNRGASPHTVRAYESDLAQFLEFLPLHNGKRRDDQRPEDCDVAGDRIVPRRAVSHASFAQDLGAQAGLGAGVRQIPAPRGAD